MKDFWEIVGAILLLIGAGIAMIFAFIVAAVAVLFWPSMAVVVVFIAGRAVGVW